MTSTELKTLIINRISEINDVSFLNELKAILDSQTGTGVIRLTPKLLNDIIASKKEIESGSFVDNNLLDKEVRQWLKEKLR
jgi:hypothetical protein